MLPALLALARQMSWVLLLALIPQTALAGECCCRIKHTDTASKLYRREADHGLIHFPHATYWSSYAAPSPWAYWAIPPYPHHYHFFYGRSYGWDR